MRLVTGGLFFWIAASSGLQLHLDCSFIWIYVSLSQKEPQIAAIHPPAGIIFFRAAASNSNSIDHIYHSGNSIRRSRSRNYHSVSGLPAAGRSRRYQHHA
jgi:hypothetical protein